MNLLIKIVYRIFDRQNYPTCKIRLQHYALRQFAIQRSDDTAEIQRCNLTTSHAIVVQ